MNGYARIKLLEQSEKTKEKWHKLYLELYNLYLNKEVQVFVEDFGDPSECVWIYTTDGIKFCIYNLKEKHYEIIKFAPIKEDIKMTINVDAVERVSMEDVGDCRLLSYSKVHLICGSPKRVGDDAVVAFDGDISQIQVRLLRSIGADPGKTHLVDLKNKIAWKYELKE